MYKYINYFLVTCPEGFSWISSNTNEEDVITPDETTTTPSTRLLFEGTYDEGTDKDGTDEEEETTTTPEPTTLPDATFNQTTVVEVNVTIPFYSFGGIMSCGKTTVNVIYYNETSSETVLAGVDDKETENIDWPKCKVQMKRNDISMLSFVKFHDYDGGDIISDMWMTKELYDKYEFNRSESLHLACIFQEEDPVEFITATVTDTKDEVEDGIALNLQTSLLPTTCYVLAGEKGKEIDIENSDVYQMFYKESGKYYFGSKSTKKATFVADKITKKGELTFTESSGMVSFARNLIPGLEVTIYYIPISQGYVIIEKRIIRSIEITSKSSLEEEERRRLLAGEDNDDNSQITVVEFTQPLSDRPGYSIRVTLDTKKGTHTVAECSDNGICDRKTGQCQCFDGFSGSACQILTNCPNNCNNNGRCVEYSKILDVTKLPGINSKNIFGCKCDPGHRGPDCSLTECPSGEDPQGATNVWSKDVENSQPYRMPVEEYEHRDCSGRGICDYNTGSCQCFDGFKGTACEEMSLSTM